MGFPYPIEVELEALQPAAVYSKRAKNQAGTAAAAVSSHTDFIPS